MKNKKLVLLLPALLLFCSCDSAPVDQESFLSKLVPNWINFVTQLGALVVMIILIIIFAYKPVRKIIKQRQDYIENNILESDKNKLEALENKKKSEQSILDSQKEANEIILSAKKQALKEREDLVNETNVIISNMKKTAEKDIELAKVEAQEAINKEIVNVAFLASEEVLGREVSSKDNEKLVNEFIKDMKK